MSEKERWTTGLVCPLHVRGICLAMFPNLNKINSVKMKNPSRRPEHGIEIVTQKMNADSYYRRRFRAQDFLKGDVKRASELRLSRLDYYRRSLVSPGREFGEERGLLSRTAAGNRA